MPPGHPNQGVDLGKVDDMKVPSMIDIRSCRKTTHSKLGGSSPPRVGCTT